MGVEAVNRMSEIDTIKDVLNEDAAKDLHIKDVENKDGHAQDDMSENGEEKVRNKAQREVCWPSNVLNIPA